MAEVKTTYSADTTITLGLDVTPLASSATLVAGRESTQIDNTTNLYIDALVKGFVTVGTTPTADTNIYVYVWGSYESLATTPLDDLDGSDADRTLTNAGVRDSMLKLGAIINVTTATSNVRHHIPPFNVAQLFGGAMPKFWGLWVTHDTGVALNTTAANHVFKYNGITYTSA